MRLRLTAALLCAATLAGAGAAPASAHPMHTSEVLLGVQSGRVAGQIRLPVDRLAVVLHGAPTPAVVQRYVRGRIGAAGADGRRWRIAVGGAHAATVDGVRDLVLPLVLTPADGKVTDFTLRYDVIIDRLVTHKAIATMGGKLLGVFDWDTKALGVHAGGGSWLQGFLSAVRLGVQHIGTGADHLLFLLMLLVPAPLVARRGRWRRSDDPRRSALRVVWRGEPAGREVLRRLRGVADGAVDETAAAIIASHHAQAHRREDSQLPPRGRAQTGDGAVRRRQGVDGAR